MDTTEWPTLWTRDRTDLGASLEGQRLGLCPSSAVGKGLLPGLGTKISHVYSAAEKKKIYIYICTRTQRTFPSPPEFPRAPSESTPPSHTQLLKTCLRPSLPLPVCRVHGPWGILCVSLWAWLSSAARHDTSGPPKCIPCRLLGRNTPPHKQTSACLSICQAKDFLVVSRLGKLLKYRV